MTHNVTASEDRFFEFNRAAHELFDRSGSSGEHKAYSDRELAILCGSVLEAASKFLLSRNFVPLKASTNSRLFEGSGLLSNMNSRMELARALGAIPTRLMTEVQTIAHIRNVLAHNFREMHFAEEALDKECSKLKFTSISDAIDITKETLSLYGEDVNAKTVPSPQFLIQDQAGFVLLYFNIPQSDKLTNREKFETSVKICWASMMLAIVSKPQKEAMNPAAV